MIASQRTRFTRRRCRAIQFYTLLIVSMFVTTAAQATDLPIQGGPGGTNFRRECSGDHVVGVYVRTGEWVDAIGLKCAAFDTKGKFNPPPWNTPYFGGTSPSLRDQEGVCPTDRFVSGLMFGMTHEDDNPKFVDFIELTCTPVAGGAPPTKICLETGQGCNANGAFVQTCPAGEAATGIQGRTGLFVDALGLICAPKPAIATRPEWVGAIVSRWKAFVDAVVVWGGALSADAQTIRDTHNRHRADHCVGNLFWNRTLASGAQNWASACKFQHSTTANGENLAWGRPTLSLKDAVDRWYNEISGYNFSNPACCGPPKTSVVVGHFTQVVWRNSTDVGCGWATCPAPAPDGFNSTWQFLVCRYSPPGNFNVDTPGVLAYNVPPPCK